MRLTQTSDLWWKNAVVYCLDVETYADGNGDGCGDFRGLIQQIDHLDRLGVTCIWLMPFYPSPDRDDGYDITDFYGVDPRLGTLGEFVEFMRTARDRGIRVIADLVVNHTSIQHPWFQEARSSRDNPYRDWYVWADEPPADGPQGVVFPDKETSLWQYDDEAGQYYLHRFYKFQPDLNIANPEVRDEIARIIGFWMELGLSGFRVDAVPFLLENTGQADADAPARPARLPRRPARLPQPAQRRGRAARRGQPALRRHACSSSASSGDELTMCFDFIGMQQMYLSLVRGDAGPLAEALRDRPAAAEGRALGDVRPQPRRAHPRQAAPRPSARRSSTRSGPSKDMQLYGRGLRRRLPPMLDGDQRRIRLVYSLLFALPGTPGAVLRRGDRHGREPQGRGPARRAHADAVDRRAGRRLLDRRPVDVPGAARRGRLRARARQRPRPGARPGVAAVVLPPPHRLLPRVPGAGVGHRRRWSTPVRRPRRCSRTAPTSTASPSSPCTTSARRKATATAAADRPRGPRPVRRARRHPQGRPDRRGHHVQRVAAALRLPVAALDAHDGVTVEGSPSGETGYPD